MKIVSVDNFSRDEVSDTLIAENVSEFYATVIAKFLNQKYGGDNSPNYFSVKPDDYKLYKSEP